MSRRRAGWYFWYPFLLGCLMLVLGLGFGAGALGSGVSGLGAAAIVELVVAGGFFVWAFWARRDIAKDESDDVTIPGAKPEALVAELQATGLPGQATVLSFGYVTGSTKAGTTLVNLELEVTTTRGGTVAVKHEDRVPLDAAGQLRKGTVLPVRVSSTDPSKILIDWLGVPAPT